MVSNNRYRQTEQFIRQRRFYIAGLRSENYYLPALTAYYQFPVAAAADSLQYYALLYYQFQQQISISYFSAVSHTVALLDIERSIKPFVIDRENFLFANTPNGATCSAVMFGLTRTTNSKWAEFSPLPRLTAEYSKYDY